MAHPSKSDIIVIGAGIIGVNAALALQADGHSVRIVERKDVASEASRGNAGAFAYTDIEPLATPGIMRKAPKWLLDPLGPLSIPPAYALKIAPWMLRFWRASWPDRYDAAVRAQAELMHFSQAALERLIASVSGEDLMRREGQLQLYEGERQFRASLPSWELRGEHGIPFELLETPEAIAEIQPCLDPRFTHAGFTPGWMNTVDPEKWTRHLAQTFVERGGRIETKNVRALHATDGGAEVVTADGTLAADRVVVAAGAWSHTLAKTIGDRIPLETERGYNTTFPTADFNVRCHLSFSGHGFVVSRIGQGLRVGGAVELGGLNLPPNYKRAEILVQKAQNFLHGFVPQNGTQWMGFRPSLPDSLPVISHSPKSDSVIYAFGHGHLGLTQSAGTAELVAAIASGRVPTVALDAFDAGRF